MHKSRRLPKKHANLPVARSVATPPGPWRIVSWPGVVPPVVEPPRKRRGPKPGTVDRFGEDDRKCYPELKGLIKIKGSVAAAARELADVGKVAGTGTQENRARRLAARYRREIPR